MSNNSTSRIGSGDGKTNKCKEICPKICSDYKEIGDIEGGPCGDSPPEHQNQTRRDYLIFMLQDNEESPELSESDDQELYNLKHDYLEKLNIVRKRLNLIEINDSDSVGSGIQRGCKITEIIREDEEQEEEEVEEEKSEATKSLSRENSCKSEKSTKTTAVGITTIYPFSLTYNSASKSDQSDIFEIDYNPPKKKCCYRIKTPIPTASDCNIPYHTKVSLHEDLFRKSNTDTLYPNIWRETVSKFTANKETQCSEEYLNFSNHSSQTTSVVSRKTNLEQEDTRRNANLFPEVIIKESPRHFSASSVTHNVKEKRPKLKTIYSEVTRLNTDVLSLKEYQECKQENRKDGMSPKPPRFLSVIPEKFFSNKMPTNAIEDPTEDSYETVSSNLTVVESAYVPKKKRSFWKKRTKKTTMWNDLKQMNVSGNINSNKKHKSRYNFLTPYTSYQTNKTRPHTYPQDIKEPVIFGSLNISNFAEYQPDPFYYFSTDTEWRSSRFSVTSNSENKKRWWESIFCCFSLVWRNHKNRRR